MLALFAVGFCNPDQSCKHSFRCQAMEGPILLHGAAHLHGQELEEDDRAIPEIPERSWRRGGCRALQKHSRQGTIVSATMLVLPLEVSEIESYFLSFNL